MMHQCKFCDCILASEYSLLNHQKTAKKCLIKQGIVALGSFECDVCKETFLCKSVLKKHTVSCSKKNSTLLKIKIDKENTSLKCKLLEFENKYNMILEERKEFENKYNMILENKKELENKYNMILEEQKEFENKYNILESKYNMILEEKKECKIEQKELLNKITTAALSKTNTVKNKNINITYTRTDEELKTIYADNLTSLHIEGGISAITKLIVDKVVTDVNGIKMITITDKARGTARYKLPSGEDVVDNGLNTFTTKNRDILMRRIYSITAGDRITSDQILDVDTTISKGYTEITDDVEGDILRSSLINSI
jgi:hypothetical protein